MAWSPHSNVLLETEGRPKPRREMLIGLGVPICQAIRHARSRKGPWNMPNTNASGIGMTNAWLTQQGLLSLKTLWASLAYSPDRLVRTRMPWGLPTAMAAATRFSRLVRSCWRVRHWLVGAPLHRGS